MTQFHTIRMIKWATAVWRFIPTFHVAAGSFLLLLGSFFFSCHRLPQSTFFQFLFSVAGLILLRCRTSDSIKAGLFSLVTSPPPVMGRRSRADAKGKKREFRKPGFIPPGQRDVDWNGRIGVSSVSMASLRLFSRLTRSHSIHRRRLVFLIHSNYER